MAKNIRKTAASMGATIAGKVLETAGGSFGAARLAAIVRSRLVPSRGKRVGRPANPAWVEHPKVPMSKGTLRQLERLARRMSTKERKVSAMQVVAQLLEDSVRQMSSAVSAEAQSF
jgi:hypothetical protein